MLYVYNVLARKMNSNIPVLRIVHWLNNVFGRTFQQVRLCTMQGWFKIIDVFAPDVWKQLLKTLSEFVLYFEITKTSLSDSEIGKMPKRYIRVIS